MHLIVCCQWPWFTFSYLRSKIFTEELLHDPKISLLVWFLHQIFTFLNISYFTKMSTQRYLIDVPVCKTAEYNPWITYNIIPSSDNDCCQNANQNGWQYAKGNCDIDDRIYLRWFRIFSCLLCLFWWSWFWLPWLSLPGCADSWVDICSKMRWCHEYIYISIKTFKHKTYLDLCVLFTTGENSRSSCFHCSWYLQFNNAI